MAPVLRRVTLSAFIPGAALTPGLTPHCCPRPALSLGTRYALSLFVSSFLFSQFNFLSCFRWGCCRPSWRFWPGGWAWPREARLGVTRLWTPGCCSDHCDNFRVLCSCHFQYLLLDIITKYLITVLLWSNLLSSVCTWWCRLSTPWYTRATWKTGTLSGPRTPLDLFLDLKNIMRSH